MKPPSPSKKTRGLGELRVTRKSNVHVHTGDGHGWAVSYADLLMVLLSFFILFFSLNDQDPAKVQEQLQRIALSMKGLKPEEINRIVRKPDSVAMSNLEDILKVDGVRVTNKEDHILVELEKGVFLSGDWRLQKSLREQVDEVVARIGPFHENLNVTVIGHADKRPLIPRNLYLQDNFDLSSLRALGVLKYMIAKGFPENRASARAASSFDRDARSITFELRLARKNPGGA